MGVHHANVAGLLIVQLHRPTNEPRKGTTADIEFTVNQMNDRLIEDMTPVGPTELSSRRIDVNAIILIGVDGSETASKAAEVAASLASELKCDLRVMSAYATASDTLPRIGRLSSSSAAREEYAYRREAEIAEARSAQKTADEAAEELRQKFPGLAITSVGIEADPAKAIIEEAERLNARLVVVGNKRVQGISRILGSVAFTVARDIKTDLYIAHTR